MNKMMTKVEKAGQYIKDKTDRTIESIKGLRSRKGTYAKVPTTDDDIDFDNVLQRIKTTPRENFAIEEPTESRAAPQTTGPNIHTLNTSKDGTTQRQLAEKIHKNTILCNQGTTKIQRVYAMFGSKQIQRIGSRRLSEIQ